MRSFLCLCALAWPAMANAAFISGNVDLKLEGDYTLLITESPYIGSFWNGIALMFYPIPVISADGDFSSTVDVGSEATFDNYMPLPETIPIDGQWVTTTQEVDDFFRFGGDDGDRFVFNLDRLDLSYGVFSFPYPLLSLYGKANFYGEGTIVDTLGEFDPTPAKLRTTALFHDPDASGSLYAGSFQVSAVPEPSTLLLAGAALLFGAVITRRKSV